MKDRGPTPEVPADGMDASTPQGDWSFEEVEKVARLLYAQAPFDVKDTKCWEALVRQAFNFLDNLGQAYEETETWRGEMRAVADIVEEGHAAAAHLPDIVPFEKAVRFITGEAGPVRRGIPRFRRPFRHTGMGASVGGGSRRRIGVADPGDKFRRR